MNREKGRGWFREKKDRQKDDMKEANTLNLLCMSQ